MRPAASIALLLLAAAACVAPAPAPRPATPRPRFDPRPAALGAHIRFLADDALEGRGTGTRGYDLAARYVEAQFAALGLEPAGAAGSFLQPVPLRAARVREADCALAVVRDGAERPLGVGEDVLLQPDWLRERWTTDAPLAFAGFGVVAPELGYDDYAGLDARGKVVLVLSGAPRTFPNDQRAYHAWRQRKEADAAAHGAVGVLEVRTPEEERRTPWARALRQSRLPAMRWTDAGGAPHDVWPQLELGGTLARSGAEAAFAGAPLALDAVFALADSGRSRAFDLPSRLRARRATTPWNATSSNVVAVLRGSDPRLAREAVVVSAHLDHLGIGEPVAGDSIHNGAFDNASGVACLIETARMLAAAPRAPRRSVVFLAVCGEEKGLQGSDYFAQHPSLDLALVADLNADMFMPLDPLHAITAFGAEHSSLEGNLARVAGSLGLAVVPDPAPEAVVFIRSDQFSFVRQGVPSIYPTGMPADSAAAARHVRWLHEVYHTPQDGPDQPMDLDAEAAFARLLVALAFDVADGASRPAWKPGDFFGVTFGPRR